MGNRARVIADLTWISYSAIVLRIGSESTHNQDRRQAMKLDQAIKVYQEYHKMNSGKKYD